MIFSARIKRKGQIVLESSLVYCKRSKPKNGSPSWEGRFGVDRDELQLFEVGDRCTIIPNDEKSLYRLEIVINGFHPKSGSVLFESVSGFKKER